MRALISTPPSHTKVVSLPSVGMGGLYLESKCVFDRWRQSRIALASALGPEVGLGLLVLTFGVFVGNSTVQTLLCVLQGFLNLLELPVAAFYLSCVSGMGSRGGAWAAACTLIQNGYLTRRARLAPGPCTANAGRVSKVPGMTFLCRVPRYNGHCACQPPSVLKP